MIEPETLVCVCGRIVVEIRSSTVHQTYHNFALLVALLALLTLNFIQEYTQDLEEQRLWREHERLAGSTYAGFQLNIQQWFTIIGYQAFLAGCVPSLLLPCLCSKEHLVNYPLILNPLGADDLIHQR